jgi:hypothetical protein
MNIRDNINRTIQNLLGQPVNQKIDSDSCQYNAIDNTKKDSSFSEAKDSINNQNYNHRPINGIKKLLFSFTHLPIPHTQDLIDIVKSIIKRLVPKSK